MTSENAEIYIKVRAWGSSGAKEVRKWDDGFHLAIRHIYVYSSKNSVDGIQVAYFNPLEGSVLSPMHGSAFSSPFFEEINIPPDDRIVSVSGCYSTQSEGSYAFNEGIYTHNERKLQQLTSLKFVTATGKTYGPYGIKSACETFCFKTASGVRGFHGSISGLGLCSIGIYVQSQAPSVP